MWGKVPEQVCVLPRLEPVLQPPFAILTITHTLKLIRMARKCADRTMPSEIKRKARMENFTFNISLSYIKCICL